MKRILTLAASRPEPSALLWTVLAGELAMTAWLFAADRVPPALAHALQLFLRF